MRYVPILKWKPAEHGALSKLETPEKNEILPIIEILPLDGRYTPAELIRETTKKFQLVADKAGMPALLHGFGLDARYVFPGGTSIADLARMCAYLVRHGQPVVPVVDVDRVLTESATLPSLKSFRSVILRASLSTAPWPDIRQALADLRQVMGKRASVMLVLDCEGFGAADNPAWIHLVTPILKAAIVDGVANRIVLVGGSFPASLASYKQGRTDIERREWTIWTHFKAQRAYADVGFGDYAVTNPKLLVIPKGTPIPVLAQIRYALTDKWVLHRAAVVKGKAGFQQYKQLCTVMLASPEYRGEKFSFGDKMIRHHSDPITTTGSPQTWRRDATSHHLVYTIRQLGLPAGGIVPAMP